MADTRIEHVISCSEDNFWKVFFDPEFNKKLFLDVLGFDAWKLVRLDEHEDRIERVVEAVPKIQDLPGPLKKLVENGAGYRETGVFSRAKKQMTVSITPSALADKLTITGLMHTEPAGNGQCRRIYDQSVTAKVFGIGGLIENRIIGDVKTSYDKAAAFTNEWVKEKGLSV